MLRWAIAVPRRTNSSAVQLDDDAAGTQDWQELFDENSGQATGAQVSGRDVWTNPWENGGGGGQVAAEGCDGAATS